MTYGRRIDAPAPSLPGEQPGGERRSRPPMPPVNWDLAGYYGDNNDPAPALPGERADEEGQ